MQGHRRCLLILLAAMVLSLLLTDPASSSSTHPTSPNTAGMVAPVDGPPRYPFTRDASMACGRWKRNSRDYPYFGASRDPKPRRHAGVDLYPPQGEGAPVKAMKAGQVIKVAPFYTRANGEKTYGVLIDHLDFTANYAELKKPGLQAGQTVAKGEIIGQVSGTRQLHLELYEAGTRDWSRWYGEKPAKLLDPTRAMKELFYGEEEVEAEGYGKGAGKSR
jgi:murein DD-endopeptidase MepM/ murein hydrolase activator NlpD